MSEHGPDWKQYRVRIVNKAHPHCGEYGHFTGEVIKMVTTGNRMALVKLEACKHGTDACYVSPGDVSEVDQENQYVRRSSDCRDTEAI